MRTSSIKSIASTLMIVVLLTLAAPIAEARSNRTGSSGGRGETFIQAFVNLIKRISRVGVTIGPSIPIGSPEQGNATTPEPEPTTPVDN
jgi:hypothetical protein